MSFVLTRDQLYDLVWSEPMQRLSTQIGISDVAIAKRCRKVGVPVPERGYWNRLHAGKRVVKAILPDRDLVTINRIEMSGTLPAELRSRLKGEPGMPCQENDTLEVRTERLRKRLGTVTVPEFLAGASGHRCVAQERRKAAPGSRELALPLPVESAQVRRSLRAPAVAVPERSVPGIRESRRTRLATRDGRA